MADLSLNNLLWERRIRRYRGKDDDPESQIEGFRLFCLEQVKIEHPAQGRIPFELREAQIATARSYMTESQTIVLKARQIGFTTLTMEYCLWAALFKPDHSAIVLSKRELDAVDALRKAISAYDDLDPELRKRLPQRTTFNASRLGFDNRSYIESHPSSNNPARGRTASLTVLDELAFMPDDEEAWRSIKPVTDVGGRIAALSTAHGYGNLFHRLWAGAVTGDNNFHPIFFPWSALPERDEAWYERESRDLSVADMAQEYPSNPDEAFLKSGNPVFDVDRLRAVETRAPLERGHMVEIQDGPIKWAFQPETNGPIAVYEKPQPGHSYVIGADTAEGLARGDASVAHVIDAKNGDVVAVLHYKQDPDLMGTDLYRLGLWYRTALIGVESNNHGIVTNKSLLKLRYPRIYRQRNINARVEDQSERLGWYTSKTSKPRIIDGLGAALRDGSIHVFDAPTIEELCHYVRKDDGSTSGSPHDDRVMSLAIAVEMLTWAYSPDQQTRNEEPEWGTLAYVERVLKKQNGKKNEPWVLGRGNMRSRSRV